MPHGDPPWLAPLERPTLLLWEERARRNIRRMARRMAAAGVALRPHFKTHQSVALGPWFGDEGVTRITVSSVDMARCFADAGWEDLTIAFPVNLRQRTALRRLATEVRLGLVLDDAAVARALDQALTTRVRLWIKIDAGYGRSGLPWQAVEPIARLAEVVSSLGHLELAGLLAHAGHSYQARSPSEILAIHDDTVTRLTGLRQALGERGIGPLALSIGDTPCCSLASHFAGVDEVRPGNYVFYDLTQAHLGACTDEDLAVAVACPVVGVHPDARKLVLYGGAVHLSKDTLEDPVHGTVYGYLARPTADGWTDPDRRYPLVSLSQEHAVVTVAAGAPLDWQVGDMAIVLPVHSCLTADMHPAYVTPGGGSYERCR